MVVGVWCWAGGVKGAVRKDQEKWCSSLARKKKLDNRIKSQKGVEVIFSKIKDSNHFFKNKEKELTLEIEKYLKEKTALI